MKQAAVQRGKPDPFGRLRASRGHARNRNILIKDLEATLTIQTNTVVNDPFNAGTSYPWVGSSAAITYTNTMHVTGGSTFFYAGVSRNLSLLPNQIYRVRIDLTASSIGTSTMSFGFSSGNNTALYTQYDYNMPMTNGLSTYTFYVIPKTDQNTVYVNITAPGGSFSYDLDNFIVELNQTQPKPLYTAVVNDLTDYYAFGAIMPGRTYHISAPNAYRYGFNGQENDNEITGIDGANTYAEYWEYDTRLGRRWNMEPEIKKFPWLSPYGTFNDNPILYNDVLGNSAGVSIDKNSKTVTVEANINFYGSKVNDFSAKRRAAKIEKAYNDANGKVMIDGIEYKVQFKITGTARVDDEKLKVEIAFNTDPKQNYVRIENRGKNESSFTEGNSGYWNQEQLVENQTTEEHEFGHNIGLDHPNETKGCQCEDMDIMMTAYSYNLIDRNKYPLKKDEGTGMEYVDVTKRKVTQKNIDALKLNKVSFDKNGKGSIGGFSNKHYRK